MKIRDYIRTLESVIENIELGVDVEELKKRLTESLKGIKSDLDVIEHRNDCVLDSVVKIRNIIL